MAPNRDLELVPVRSPLLVLAKLSTRNDLLVSIALPATSIGSLIDFLTLGQWRNVDPSGRLLQEHFVIRETLSVHESQQVDNPRGDDTQICIHEEIIDRRLLFKFASHVHLPQQIARGLAESAMRGLNEPALNTVTRSVSSYSKISIPIVITASGYPVPSPTTQSQTS